MLSGIESARVAVVGALTVDLELAWAATPLVPGAEVMLDVERKYLLRKRQPYNRRDTCTSFVLLLMLLL